MYQLTPPYGIQAPVAVKTFVPTFMCPSDSGAAVASNVYGINGDLAPSNYAFCLGTGTSRGKRDGWGHRGMQTERSMQAQKSASQTLRMGQATRLVHRSDYWAKVPSLQPLRPEPRFVVSACMSILERRQTMPIAMRRYV